MMKDTHARKMVEPGLDISTINHWGQLSLEPTLLPNLYSFHSSLRAPLFWNINVLHNSTTAPQVSTALFLLWSDAHELRD